MAILPQLASVSPQLDKVLTSVVTFGTINQADCYVVSAALTAALENSRINVRIGPNGPDLIVRGSLRAGAYDGRGCLWSR